MKRILYKSLALVLMAAFAITGFTGCTKEYYEDHTQTIIGPTVVNYPFLIGNIDNIDIDGDWTWNEANARYECFVDFKELTKEIYDEGTMVGAVFVNPGESGEWLELLPYQAVYYYDDDEGNQVPYSVLISCAFTPGEVGFFLQLSDRYRDDNVLAPYEFKVTLIDKNRY